MHTTRAQVGRRWFIGATGLMTVAHPVLPAEIRSITFLLVSALTVLPLIALLRRLPSRDRLVWWILLGAMTVLTGGNALTTFGRPAQLLSAELVITVAHAALLAAAVALVLRRGRNDIGGVLDVSLAAVGLGGLVWTALLQPRLQAMHSGLGEQIELLVSVLVLVGVLGALVRVGKVAGQRLPALNLLICALTLALAGNVVLALSNGSMTSARPGWIEMFFMVAYLCVGAAPLEPSVDELMRAGPAPVDGLSVGRLVFLGAALAVNPVAGGIREMAGLNADGPLLALGSLLVVPLVMLRVGRLAAERQRAEAALRHQATHDLLTGLPNRGELLTRLDAALNRERSGGRARVVLLFCDLNGFKGVNDRLGHLAGDRLLIGVGERIRAGLRPGETLARYGGDEFLVLCEDAAPEDAALRLAAHIERVLEEPFDLVGERVRIGISVGTVLSGGDLRADELIRRADQAMYAAKPAVPLGVR
jgi:diguanylate cyclase